MVYGLNGRTSGRAPADRLAPFDGPMTGFAPAHRTRGRST